MSEQGFSMGRLTRRGLIGALGAAAAAAPALAEEACQIGPAPHPKGQLVYLNYDQIELDAAYDQSVYERNIGQIVQRLTSTSAEVRRRIGDPQRVSYGPTAAEKLDIYRTDRPKAPIFFFIHGGAWRSGTAADYGYPAEMFTKAGVHYVSVDFVQIEQAAGDLAVMAAQVRRAIAWVHRNALSFGGDSNKLYVGGHSSGGHLCGVALTTEWPREFGLPEDVIKGGLCMSGMYDMKPVRMSKRNSYVRFTDATEDSLSAQRHIDRLHAPVTVTYGSFETPEFQRQGRDFAAAVEAAGKPAKLIAAPNYAHLEMVESLGNPYGVNGRAALALMGLAQA